MIKRRLRHVENENTGKSNKGIRKRRKTHHKPKRSLKNEIRKKRKNATLNFSQVAYSLSFFQKRGQAKSENPPQAKTVPLLNNAPKRFLSNFANASHFQNWTRLSYASGGLAGAFQKKIARSEKKKKKKKKKKMLLPYTFIVISFIKLISFLKIRVYVLHICLANVLPEGCYILSG
ncbi:hypothetical protein [Brackiella oedipodis]|uniref:hypothetical protein n=1 Tax=Brackiella oedipodis TaxID=124225 RepID=UPI00048D8DE2|nr:hypothetical protein [Brackiella oedipodis]